MVTTKKGHQYIRHNSPPSSVANVWLRAQCHKTFSYADTFILQHFDAMCSFQSSTLPQSQQCQILSQLFSGQTFGKQSRHFSLVTRCGASFYCCPFYLVSVYVTVVIYVTSSWKFNFSYENILQFLFCNIFGVLDV